MSYTHASFGPRDDWDPQGAFSEEDKTSEDLAALGMHTSSDDDEEDEDEDEDEETEEGEDGEKQEDEDEEEKEAEEEEVDDLKELERLERELQNDGRELGDEEE